MTATTPHREPSRTKNHPRRPSKELKLGNPPQTAVEDGISDEQIEWLRRLVAARRTDREPQRKPPE